MSRCNPVPVSEALDGFVGAFGCFVYDYQGIIGAGLAILAALYAGIPVWRQLKHTDLQTIIVHRQTLSLILEEVELRLVRVDEKISHHIERLIRDCIDDDGLNVIINPHMAFSYEGYISQALEECKLILMKSELPSIDRAKSKFYESTEELIADLGLIHLPASSDQSGEDWSYTDEQWKEYLALSEAARLGLPDAALSVDEALSALQKEQNAWVRDLQARIAKLDVAIAKWDGTA